MKTSSKLRKLAVGTSLLTIGLSSFLMPASAQAQILRATSGGTFTFNFDRDALALAGYQQIIDNSDPLHPVYAPNTTTHPGLFVSSFWDTANSGYLNSDPNKRTDGYFTANNGHTEASAINLVHDLVTTAGPGTGTNEIAGQATGRHVKGLGSNFGIDSVSLAGTGSSAATQALGMTGVQGFWIPYYGANGGTVFYGDFSLRYSATARQNKWTSSGITGQTASGWYLQNNISFAAIAYDLANLHLEVTDANNWMLTGDLLSSPENAAFIKSANLADMGDFCMGVGSYSGCGHISSVPLPGAVWFFGSGVVGFMVNSRRRLSHPA